MVTAVEEKPETPSCSQLSIIAPLYNEGDHPPHLLAHLRQLPDLAEVVLVDASDEPASLAVIHALERQLHGDPLVRLLRCPLPGRARQMNLGARHCRGAVLLFLHCDTRLPSTAAREIARGIARRRQWGWFDLRLDAAGLVYRLIERMISLRARVRRIATGDQAMFVQRRVFVQQRGFAEIDLMEDIEMSCRLKRLSAPAVVPQPVLTSARRWRQGGVVRTVLLMWKLRFLYWLGRSPEQLAARYRHVR